MNSMKIITFITLLLTSNLIYGFTLNNRAAMGTKSECTTPGDITITIDEGPHAEYTELIINTLKEKNSTATFHVVTDYIGKGASNDISFDIRNGMLKKAYENGNVIGLRLSPKITDNLPKMTDTELKDEINKESEVIYNIIGAYPRFIRVPVQDTKGNFFDDTVLSKVDKVIGELDMIMTQWSVDSTDWDSSLTAEGIFTKISDSFNLYNTSSSQSLNLKAKYIILLHDLYPVTTQVLPSVIDLIGSFNYTVANITKCVGVDNAYRKAVTTGSNNNNSTTVVKPDDKNSSLSLTTSFVTIIISAMAILALIF